MLWLCIIQGEENRVPVQSSHRQLGLFIGVLIYVDECLPRGRGTGKEIEILRWRYIISFSGDNWDESFPNAHRPTLSLWPTYRIGMSHSQSTVYKTSRVAATVCGYCAKWVEPNNCTVRVIYFGNHRTFNLHTHSNKNNTIIVAECLELTHHRAQTAPPLGTDTN